MSEPTPAPGVAGVRAYRPQPVPAHVTLKLDGNEGAPPPADLLERLAALGSDVMRRYPDSAELERLLAARFEVAPGRVLVTAGGDDAIGRACTAALCPGREALMTSPTFEMIPRYVALAGATGVTVPWTEGEFPADEMTARVRPETALVAAVTPNNPTGLTARGEHLEALSRAAPHALLLADLAYTEFADEDLTDRALALPNAVVVRTLSKAWGLAGLRVGYAVGPAHMIEWMRAAGQPYAVSRPSLALAAARLAGGDADTQRFVAMVRGERARIAETLTECGAHPLPSQANFVFARFRDAAWVRAALLALGIAVRGFAGPDLANGLRITCPGNPADCDRLVRALRTVLRPKAVCFDDGLTKPDLAIPSCGEPRGGAWFVTARAEMVAAAREQGALPIGIGADLAEAGVARVLTDPNELKELLP